MRDFLFWALARKGVGLTAISFFAIYGSKKRLRISIVIGITDTHFAHSLIYVCRGLIWRVVLGIYERYARTRKGILTRSKL